MKATKQKNKTVEELYQKKTQLEHILIRPDTYIGSVEIDTQQMFTITSDNTIKLQKINYPPGLYKIFDEIIVNSADNKQRDASMTYMKVSINQETNTISVKNDGKGIPIEIHKKEKVYVPELIFGHLLTSSNYNDAEKKVTGGRNGFGAKLCNIFSYKFVVETVHNNKQYKQTFENNMSKIGAPEIKSVKSEDYTKITFKPDLKRFSLDKITDDVYNLLKKRVYDMAGVVRGVKVYFNNERIKIKDFREYCALYFDSCNSINGSSSSNSNGNNTNNTIANNNITTTTIKLTYERNERWEVGFIPSESFNQVSFVNSICTSKGGTHVNKIVDQIVERVTEKIKKKEKLLTIKPAHVKSNLFIFINSLIENPAFDSQTKETLTLRSTAFGSQMKLSEDFINQVYLKIQDSVVEFSRLKQSRELKKTDGAKKTRVLGIEKLEDANNAGKKRLSAKCALILTEGDSAKAMAMHGLSVVGRDNYGVFPLRGKLLNVREAPHSQILKNEEISNIKKILGLQHGKKYEDASELRYGSIIIMTDQDHDGSHIKGLLINFFDHFYPSLLKLDGFLKEFVTPIIKATNLKRKEVLSFFTIPEYLQFIQSFSENGNIVVNNMTGDVLVDFDGSSNINSNGGSSSNGSNGNISNTNTGNITNINISNTNINTSNRKLSDYKIKYFKGLGTSTKEEAKEYFSNLPVHLKEFKPLTSSDTESVQLAFAKKRAEHRKVWLANHEPGTFISHADKRISISNFVNKELILFSLADNMRSIPSLVDGLKPGQRKIMYAAFKKNLVSEIKVAQFIGYVSEKSNYHHGEQSLSSTIINLAQNFVGSNNINLLFPSGQFGSRYLGGKDAASPRYIFTLLTQLALKLFHKDDMPILDYLAEENQKIEPSYYVPIVPIVLINGAEGIGTGWSTNVPSFNPIDLVENIKRMISNRELKEMVPFYRGFKGTISNNSHSVSSISLNSNSTSNLISNNSNISLISNNNTSNNTTSDLNLSNNIHNSSNYFLNIENIKTLIPNYESLQKPSKFKSTGIYEINDNTIDIYEININSWITPYKNYLQKYMENNTISDIKEYHADDDIHFRLEVKPEFLKGDVSKKLKMESSIPMTNMVLFDSTGRIRRYNDVYEILAEFYTIRLKYYHKRKEYMLKKLEMECLRLKNRSRFIEEVNNGIIKVRNVIKSDLVKKLIERGYDDINFSICNSGGDADNATENINSNEKGNNKEYGYLLNMPIISLTKERAEKMKQEYLDKVEERKVLEKKSVQKIWIEDLDEFLESYEEFLKVIEEGNSKNSKSKKVPKRTTRTNSKNVTSKTDSTKKSSSKTKKAGVAVKSSSKNKKTDGTKKPSSSKIDKNDQKRVKIGDDIEIEFEKSSDKNKGNKKSFSMFNRLISDSDDDNLDSI